MDCIINWVFFAVVITFSGILIFLFVHFDLSDGAKRILQIGSAIGAANAKFIAPLIVSAIAVAVTAIFAFFRNDE